MKKVQPKGVGLRCEIHRRNGGQSTADSWEWEDAWDRLPGDMRLKVAAIDVDVLEAAMHQATSTHRYIRLIEIGNPFENNLFAAVEISRHFGLTFFGRKVNLSGSNVALFD